MDLVVAGKALLRGRLLDCEIGIAGGRIARVAKSLGPAEAAGARRLGVARGFVTAGAIDAHVHLREPGLEHKESVPAGTLAALHGGATTVLEMPNTVPPCDSPQRFEDKRRVFDGRSHVDWGLHAMVDADLRAFDLGARPVGYKAYLGGSTHAPGLSPGNLGLAAKRAHAAGRPLIVHAEHPAQLGQQGGDDWQAHGKARPVAAELEGIAALARQAPEGARILVAHCTTARGLAAARKAGLATEVTPHHLLLDDRRLQELGPRAQVNPPLRGPKERAALWKAFTQGKATTLGSDHAPHTAEEKARGFAQAPSGMPGVETMVPLLMAKVKTRALTLPTLARAMAEGPAQVFGLPKGRIAEGLDADLAVWDLTQVRAIAARDLHSKCGWTCFEGHPAVFPSTVLLRGEVALERGEATGVRGREVRPAEPGGTGKPS